MVDARAAGAVASNPGYRATVVRAFAASAFLVENGIRFVDCGPGWCEASVALTSRHLQHTGVPHAGIVATIADHTAGGAAMTLAEAGWFVLTTNLNVSLLRGVVAKRLVCRAEVVKPGRSVSFAKIIAPMTEKHSTVIIQNRVGTRKALNPGRYINSAYGPRYMNVSPINDGDGPRLRSHVTNAATA